MAVLSHMICLYTILIGRVRQVKWQSAKVDKSLYGQVMAIFILHVKNGDLNERTFDLDGSSSLQALSAEFTIGREFNDE